MTTPEKRAAQLRAAQARRRAKLKAAGLRSLTIQAPPDALARIQAFAAEVIAQAQERAKKGG